MTMSPSSLDLSSLLTRSTLNKTPANHNQTSCLVDHFGHRHDLLVALRIYGKSWLSDFADYLKCDPHEGKSTAVSMVRFVEESPCCFERSNLAGHMTGSALVVNPSLDRVLLTHHKKLGMWLQLGGHADGNNLMHHVALQEAREESGLGSLSFLPYESAVFGDCDLAPWPFDIDIHRIPANTREPEHSHYDVRYLVVATREVTPVISEESHDVRWFTLGEARRVTAEPSMHRQFSKLDWLRGKMAAAISRRPY